jgi:hypothetical protein
VSRAYYYLPPTDGVGPAVASVVEEDLRPSSVSMTPWKSGRKVPSLRRCGGLAPRKSTEMRPSQRPSAKKKNWHSGFPVQLGLRLSLRYRRTGRDTEAPTAKHIFPLKRPFSMVSIIRVALCALVASLRASLLCDESHRRRSVGVEANAERQRQRCPNLRGPTPPRRNME